MVVIVVSYVLLTLSASCNCTKVKYWRYDSLHRRKTNSLLKFKILKMSIYVSSTKKNYIRVTYGWHTSTYEWHAYNIPVHTSDIQMTYEYIRMTHRYIRLHTSDIRMTYKYIRVTYHYIRVHTSDIQMTYQYIRVTYKWHTST